MVKLFNMQEMLTKAISFKKDFITKHPHTKDDVEDFFQLMLDEIECGESPSNEYEHFIQACEDLLD